ncbi:MAG: 3'-5' exonuclease, partial [Chloroflexota bacterium]
TPPQDGDSSGRGVALSTLHAAKGLEYRAVFLPGCEEGLLPHRRSLDRADQLAEERRLCYVGMTRARDYLYCSYARTRLLGGQFHTGSRSRFLTEMGISSMDVRSSPRLAFPPRVHTAHPRERIPGKDDNGRRL